jgi:hypothetical protein
MSQREKDYERARRYVADRIGDYTDGIYSFDGFNKTVQTKLNFTNWGLFPKDEQKKVYQTIRPTVLENIRRAPDKAVPITRDNIDDVIEQLDSLPSAIFPEPEQKGFITKVMGKIKDFLGRLF